MKIVKNNLKVIFAIIITAIISSGIAVFATIQVNANQINYNTTTVADALDSMYNTIFSNNYSTTEKVVGKWIDGKPLYQRTFQVTTATDSLYTRYSLTDVDYDFLNISNAVLRRNNGAYVSMNTNNGVVKFLVYVEAERNFLIAVADDANNKGATAYITVQYTKNSNTASN